MPKKTAKKKAPQKKPAVDVWIVAGVNVWAEFLRVRKLVIDAMVSEGDSFEHIAKTLSMDRTQAWLIATSPVEP